MRPLILRMQAFGPYAERQEVDFRWALDSGLFGIYGATGSGKSSIFSAMTFALFGEAAKGEQLTRTLRSDHAAPDMPTEVELIFEVGDTRYRVVRRPEQVRPGKRGGGETEEKHSAWLFDVTGIEPDDVGEVNPGKPIAERNVRKVKAAVTELLGYEASQFRQIVLLPQGRFETFLNAKTDERVEILRELFDVATYRSLTERLKERAKDVRNQVNNRRSVSAGRLASENFESLERLAEAIGKTKTKCAQLAEEKANTETAVKKADAAYQQAAQTDKQFAAHADAEKHLRSVQSRAQSIEADKTRLQSARSAAALAPKAEAVVATESAAKEASRTRDEAAAQKQKAEAAVKAVTDRLMAIEAKSDAIEAERERRRKLEGFKTRLEAGEALRRSHVEAERIAAEREGAFSDAEKKQYACADKQKRYENEREVARTAEVQRSKLKLEVRETEGRLEAARNYEKAERALAQSREQHARAREANETEKGKLDAVRRAFSALEAALLESQAQHLAAHLEPGEPCPVCGSPEHPAPAAGTGADGDLAARYRDAKSDFERAEREAKAALTAFTRAEAHVKQREENLAGLAKPEGTSSELESALETTRRELAGLGPERDMDELDAKVAQAAKDLAAAQAVLQTARDDRDNARLAANEARAKLESALAAIPEELRAADRLDAAIDAARDQITAYERDHKETRQAKEKADTELASARTASKLAEEAVKAAKTSASKALEHFDASLRECGLTQKAFQAARADIDQIDQLDDGIRSFGEQLAAARDRLARAEAAIAETDRPDIAALKKARDEAQAGQKKLVEESARAAARLDQLNKLHRELEDEFVALDRLETETGPLRDLAGLLSGDNKARMTLETFAIATMFDHVLEAANLRLAPMTRGRFRLLRVSEDRGRAARGLDIAVEDSFTGRARPTSTLSGGETFIAALALALGLSDVVESTRGNVRLDAIFIDEGFGSLDSADDSGTLDQVLQSLIELVGSRRAVGLISHVPLVQQTVQNGFWVSSSPTGSHIEERT